MKKSLLIILLLNTTALCALRTSVGSGDWDVAGTWDTGVPVNGDTFLIAAGHTVNFNVDQTGMANGMGTSQVAATGKLNITDDAGTYYLKMNGDLDLDGTLQAGTSSSVPFTGTFTIQFNSGSNSIVTDSTTGALLLYCAEPTYKYVSLTAQAAAAQADLTVDTDVTSDWNIGDTIAIIDLRVPGGADAYDNEEDTIQNITATTITCVNNLGATKEIGAIVVLVTRNIRLIDSTDAFVKGGGTGSYLGCEAYNGATAAAAVYDGVNSSTIAGCVQATGTSWQWSIYNCSSITFSGVIVSTDGAGQNGFQTCFDSTFSDDSLVAGVNTAFSYCIQSFFNCDIIACRIGFINQDAFIITSNAKILGCRYSFSNCTDFVCYCDVLQTDNGVYYGGNFIFANCTFAGDGPGGVGSTYGMFGVTGPATFYNVLHGATTEYYGYSTAGMRHRYTESFDHDQVENAYKAWCLGGVDTSSTAAPLPTGESIKYILTAEDTTQTYSVFRQYETVVQPGTAIEVSGYLAIPNGEDLTGIAPYIAIADSFADPLVDSSKSYLDIDYIPDPDGSETGFQAVSVIWANQGDSPRNVKVRMVAEHDGGVDDVVIYSSWSIADYQDQIQSIYDKLPTNYIMGSSVQTDKDDEIDDILADTAAMRPYVYGYYDDADLADSGWCYVLNNVIYQTAISGQSLTTIDANDPSNLLQLDEEVNATYLNGAEFVEVIGDYAYVTAIYCDTFSVWDVSDKTAITLADSITNTEIGGNALVGAAGAEIVDNIWGRDRIIFIANYNADCMTALDISTPASVSHITTTDADSTNCNQIINIIRVGDYLYSVSRASKKLNVWDISVTDTITYVTSLSDTTYKRFERLGGMCPANGNYLYIPCSTNDSLSVVSIEDRENPVIVGHIKDNKLLEGAYVPAIMNPSNILVTARYGNYVTQIDVSDPCEPFIVDWIHDDTYLNAPDDVQWHKGLAYVTCTTGHMMTVVRFPKFNEENSGIEISSVSSITVDETLKRIKRISATSEFE